MSFCALVRSFVYSALQRKAEGLIDENEKPMQRIAQTLTSTKRNRPSASGTATTPGFQRDLSFRQEFGLIGAMDLDEELIAPVSNFAQFNKTCAHFIIKPRQTMKPIEKEIAEEVRPRQSL